MAERNATGMAQRRPNAGTYSCAGPYDDAAPKKITANHDSKTTFAKFVVDLVNDRLQGEKTGSDDTTMQVKVMFRETGVSGVEELLNRCNPTRITRRP